MNGLMDKVEVLQCEDDIRNLELCIAHLLKIDPTNIAPDNAHGLKRMKIVRDHLRICLRHAQTKMRREFLSK